jgi:hypothetical protein
MAAVEAFIEQRRARQSPAERGETIDVPQLVVERDGQRELIYPETLVDLGGWEPISGSARPARLIPATAPPQSSASTRAWPTSARRSHTSD